MSEPVKLSRERWDSLAAWLVSNQLSPDATYTRSSHDAAVDSVHLFDCCTIDGVTFLPATYVRGGESSLPKVMMLARGGAH